MGGKNPIVQKIDQYKKWFLAIGLLILFVQWINEGVLLKPQDFDLLTIAMIFLAVGLTLLFVRRFLVLKHV